MSANAEQNDRKIMDALFGILGVDETALGDDEWASLDEPRAAQPWVLSIEDDDNVALALQMRLQQVGIQLVQASAGMEGYRRAFMDAPSAVLLDYELPAGNGDYVLRRLKESPATNHIPVIVLTGRREPSIERQMRSLGADKFLTKPFKWQQLWESLEDCLQGTLVA